VSQQSPEGRFLTQLGHQPVKSVDDGRVFYTKGKPRNRTSLEIGLPPALPDPAQDGQASAQQGPLVETRAAFSCAAAAVTTMTACFSEALGKNAPFSNRKPDRTGRATVNFPGREFDGMLFR
jgi:hypothetical protein